MASTPAHGGVPDYNREIMQRSAVSPADGAVFYSGFSPSVRAENRKLAQDYVAMQPPGRAAMVDQTPLGRYLDSEELYASQDRRSEILPDSADRIWASASKRFAAEATGKVTCFVDGARPEGIFRQTEMPVLLANAQITHLNNISVGELRNAYAKNPALAFRGIASAAPDFGPKHSGGVEPHVRPVSRAQAAEAIKRETPTVQERTR